jgi:hypothetical protein
VPDRKAAKTATTPEPEVRLEDAIDALLADVAKACDRFENPPSQPDFEDPAEAGEASAPETIAPTDVEDAEIDAAVSSGDAGAEHETGDASADAERALEQLESNAEDLLGQAADALLGELEAPSDGQTSEDFDEETQQEPAAAESASIEAEPVVDTPVSEADIGSNEDALGAVADDLLDELSFDDETPEPADDGAEASGKTAIEDMPEAEQAESSDLLDAAVGDLLGEDTAEDSTEAEATAEDEPDQSEAIESAVGDDPESDPLDSDAFDALLDGDPVPERAEPQPKAADPEPEAEPEPEPEFETVAAVMTPPASGINETASVPSAEPEAERAASSVQPTKRAHPLFERIADRMPAVVKQAGAWLWPRAATAGRAGVKAASPLGARALMLMSKPLEKQPPKVRDSIGWVALWTLFLAMCVWGSLLLRSPDEKPNDGQGTGIASLETDVGE